MSARTPPNTARHAEPPAPAKYRQAGREPGCLDVSAIVWRSTGVTNRVAKARSDTECNENKVACAQDGLAAIDFAQWREDEGTDREGKQEH